MEGESDLGGNITDYMVGGGDNYNSDITDTIVGGGCGGGDTWMQDFMQALLVALIIVIIFCLWRMSMTMTKKNAGFSTTALADSGWYLYTRPGCSWCHKQLEALGGAYKNRIDCGADGANPAPPAGAPACNDPKISGYPFWHNLKTGQSKTGFQNLTELSAMAGVPAADCPPPPACPPPTVCPPPPVCPPVDCASCK